MQCAKHNFQILSVLALGLFSTPVLSGDREYPFAEIPAGMKAKGALSAAVLTAERAAGGRAIEAEIDQEDGSYIFEVATRNATGVQELSLSAKGDVIANEEEGLLGRLFDSAPDLLALVKSSLADAITAVEARLDGFVTSAELEFENGRPIYEVEAMGRDGIALEAIVDASTGQVITIHTEDE